VRGQGDPGCPVSRWSQFGEATTRRGGSHLPTRTLPEPLDDFVVQLLKARKAGVIDVAVGGKGLDPADAAAPERLLRHEVDLDLAPIDAVHRGEDPPALEPDARLGRGHYDLADAERQLLKATIEGHLVWRLAFENGLDAEPPARVRLVPPGERTTTLRTCPHAKPRWRRMGESDETIRSALVALKHPEREADEATRWVQASRGGSDVDHPGSQRGRS